MNAVVLPINGTHDQSMFDWVLKDSVM